MQALENSLISAWFLAIVHLLILGVLITLIVITIRRFFRRTKAHLSEKLFAITLTVLFFSKTIQSAIVSPIYRLVTNLETLFYLINNYTSANGSEEARRVLEAYPLDKKILFSDIILNYPLSSLLVAIAVAIILYYFIREIGSNFSAKPDGPAKPKPYLVYNLLVVAILAFSLYLVIGVCIAIPFVNELKKPTPFTKQVLDSTLSHTSDKDTLEYMVERSPFWADTLENPITDTPLKKAYDGLTAVPGLLNQANHYIDAFNSTKNAVIPGREMLQHSLNEYAVTTYRSQKAEVRSEVVLRFDVAVESRTDKQILFDQSIQDYVFSLGLRKDYFRSIVSEMHRTDLTNASIRHNNLNTVQEMILSLSRINPKDSFSPYTYLPPLTQYIDYPTFSPDRMSYSANGGNDKSNWGIFEFIAGYLIHPQSNELVLMIGMLGFGLLGASILSFRESEPNETMLDGFLTKPLIVRFGNVLARGFGAALVVYVATKAGLAIFSMGSASDTNGYMLLLSCFAGAVFSQSVWDKLSNTVKGWAGQKTDPQPQPQPNAKPAPNPQPNPQPNEQPQPPAEPGDETPGGA